jgi:hypothetical protein
MPSEIGSPIFQDVPVTPQTSPSLKEFANALQHYFAQEPIPAVSSDEEFLFLAQGLNTLPTFTTYNLPNPEAYDNWKDWATDVSMLMNGPTY